MAVWNRSRSRPKSQPSDEPYRERKFVASAGFLACVVVLGAVVVMSGGTGPAATSADDPEAAGASSVSEPPGPGSSTGPAPSLSPAAAAEPCPTTAPGDPTVPQSAPADVTWSPYGAGVLPFSTVAGPTRGTEAVVRCFAHTPEGALLAAAQISDRLEGPDWRTVADQCVAPGVERDQGVATRERLAQTAIPSPSTDTGDEGFHTMAGFRFVSYADTAAVVQLVRANTNATGFQASMYRLSWTGGDWKLQIQPDGSTAFTTEWMAAPVGYTAWSAGAP